MIVLLGGGLKHHNDRKWIAWFRRIVINLWVDFNKMGVCFYSKTAISMYFFCEYNKRCLLPKHQPYLSAPHTNRALWYQSGKMKRSFHSISPSNNFRNRPLYRIVQKKGASINLPPAIFLFNYSPDFTSRKRQTLSINKTPDRYAGFESNPERPYHYADGFTVWAYAEI